MPNIIAYLGEKHGLAGDNMIDRYHAQQIAITFADLQEEAVVAWHPINKHDAYSAQKEEAKPTIAEFLEKRVPRWMGYFEDCLKANNGGQGWMVGNSMTFADIAMLANMRGYKGSAPEHYDANDKIPLLKALE